VTDLLLIFCILLLGYYRSWLKGRKDEDGQDLYGETEREKLVEGFPGYLASQSTQMHQREKEQKKIEEAREEGISSKEYQARKKTERAERAAAKALATPPSGSRDPQKKRKQYTPRGTPGAILKPSGRCRRALVDLNPTSGGPFNDARPLSPSRSDGSSGSGLGPTWFRGAGDKFPSVFTGAADSSWWPRSEPLQWL